MFVKSFIEQLQSTHYQPSTKWFHHIEVVEEAFPTLASCRNIDQELNETHAGLLPFFLLTYQAVKLNWIQIDGMKKWEEKSGKLKMINEPFNLRNDSVPILFSFSLWVFFEEISDRNSQLCFLCGWKRFEFDKPSKVLWSDFKFFGKILSALESLKSPCRF